MLRLLRQLSSKEALAFAASSAAFSLGLASSANAALQMSVSVGSDIQYFVDGGAGDLDNSVGSLSLNEFTLAGIRFVGLMAKSGPADTLASNLTLIENTLTSDTRLVTVAVSDTDFGPKADTAAVTGAGTLLGQGSSASLSFFNDPANRQGASDGGIAFGNEIASFTSVNSMQSMSFSFNPPAFALAFPDTDVYSMTLAFELSLPPGGLMTSGGQLIEKTFSGPGTAPEPSTLALLGLGLAGLAAARRRKQ